MTPEDRAAALLDELEAGPGMHDTDRRAWAVALLVRALAGPADSPEAQEAIESFRRLNPGAHTFSSGLQLAVPDCGRCDGLDPDFMGLVRKAHDDPADPVAAGALADWLEERGGPGGAVRVRRLLLEAGDVLVVWPKDATVDALAAAYDAAQRLADKARDGVSVAVMGSPRENVGVVREADMHRAGYVKARVWVVKRRVEGGQYVIDGLFAGRAAALARLPAHWHRSDFPDDSVSCRTTDGSGHWAAEPHDVIIPGREGPT